MARKATVGLRIRRRELSSEVPQAGAWRPKNDLMLAKRASIALRMLRFDEQRSNLPRQNYGDLLCLCAVCAPALLLRPGQPMSQRINCQLYTIAQVQFVEYIVEMRLDRGFSDCETLRDLGIA